LRREGKHVKWQQALLALPPSNDSRNKRKEGSENGGESF
jgi:hypothetical protein